MYICFSVGYKFIHQCFVFRTPNFRYLSYVGLITVILEQPNRAQSMFYLNFISTLCRKIKWKNPLSVNFLGHYIIFCLGFLGPLIHHMLHRHALSCFVFLDAWLIDPVFVFFFAQINELSHVQIPIMLMPDDFKAYSKIKVDNHLFNK